MALIIAVLYFGLIELMLYDASRELAEARRFRARIVALTLAENGAELAAVRLADTDVKPAKVEGGDWQGTIAGDMNKNNQTGDFTINGTGVATGIVEVHATVEIVGRVNGNDVHVYYTRHSQ
ncbi:MAG: hypothetical protein ACJ74H_22520 [Thermoanaerobaculia bacterium]